MSDDAMKALAEVEAAFNHVTRLATYGTPGESEAEDLDEAGRVAERALSLLPTLRAALTPPADAPLKPGPADVQWAQDTAEAMATGYRSKLMSDPVIGAMSDEQWQKAVARGLDVSDAPGADGEVEAIRLRAAATGGADPEYVSMLFGQKIADAFADRATLLRALAAERARRVEVEDNARLLVRDEHGFLVPRKETP